jgi:hypothetical protein
VATTYELPYRLPRTEIVVSGIHSYLDDQIVPEWSGESIRQLDIAVQTVADLRSKPVLELSQRFLSNYSGAVTQHADGRLSSAQRSHSGQGGTVIKSLATLAGAVARGLALATAPEGRPVNKETGDDRQVSERYAVQCREASDRRSKIARLQREAHKELVRLAEQVLEKTGTAARAKARMAEIQSALASLDSERRLAELHFEAWRASTRSSVENRFELRIPVAELPATTSDLEASQSPAGERMNGVPASLHDLWQRFGIGLLATWGDGRELQPQAVDDLKPSTIIQARHPDHLTLEVVHGQREQTVLDISHHLAVDEFSRLEKFDISRNIFRETRLEVTFDAQGMLIGASSSSTSALAGALGTAAAIPGALASGADSTGSVQTSLFEGRRASADAELARLRQEIRSRQERIVAVGAGILPEDAAELQRLRRFQSILDAQSRTSGADPALVSELAGHLGNSWDWRGLPSTALEIRIDGGTPASGIESTENTGGEEDSGGPRDPVL